MKKNILKSIAQTAKIFIIGEIYTVLPASSEFNCMKQNRGIRSSEQELIPIRVEQHVPMHEYLRMHTKKER